jgi:MoaA/NifB/PqqE/SkfB family radical SAM enzyme
MLSDMKNHFSPPGFDRFKQMLLDIRAGGRFKNLILSGAEVTTFNDLDQYTGFAASLGWFKKMQIQTNGIRLADNAYLAQLTGSGVNEFFISIHGLEEVHDHITQAAGSFKETMAGIRNLKDYSVNAITNTVLTRHNYRDIVPLMDQLCRTRTSEIHLWNFYPMEPFDSRDMVVNIHDIAVLLRAILPLLRAAGKPLVLKSFPECLPLGEPGFHDSHYPAALLPDEFWERFDDSGFGQCYHRHKGRCSNGDCWGLSRAYIEKYGDERDRLSPM